MTRSRTVPVVLVALFAGCLWGSMETTDAEVILTSPDKEAFGFALAGFFYGNLNTTPDVAVGAWGSSTVYIFNDISQGGTLDTSQAVTFKGVEGGEAGWSLASGWAVGEKWTWLYRDLVIGAPVEDDSKGRVYVLEAGSMDADIVEEGFLELVGVDEGEYAGWDVALGYVNGDDYPDILIGACGANGANGRAYIVYGQDWARGTEVDLADADVIIEGATDEQIGCVLAAGDVNGDGQDEIILGGQSGRSGKGRVHVIYEVGAGRHDVDDITGQVVFKGSDVNAQLGTEVAVGDFNGDGIDDLAMGEPDGWCSFVGTCPEEPGAVFIKLGVQATIGDTITWDSGLVVDEADITLNGTVGGDRFGTAITFVSDLNGDEYDDLAIGAPGADTTFVWYGRSNSGQASFSQADDVDANATVDGTALGLHSGWAVATAGDISGDGEHELIIGAPGLEWVTGSIPQHGEAYIFLGEEYDTGGY